MNDREYFQTTSLIIPAESRPPGTGGAEIRGGFPEAA